MPPVTLQIIDGFEKGRVYTELATPITIGREEDNTIQLNDERVSRFHAKIQEDNGRLILTDLESTNGTRVNGHPVQMRVLQIGDHLALGRSLLIFGSVREISDRSQEIREQKLLDNNNMTVALPATGQAGAEGAESSDGLDFISSDPEDARTELFPQGPPEIPCELRPVQAAQLSDLLAYIHEQMALVVDSANEVLDAKPPQMKVDWGTWQRLLKLEMEVATYLRRIADPHA